MREGETGGSNIFNSLTRIILTFAVSLVCLGSVGGISYSGLRATLSEAFAEQPINAADANFDPDSVEGLDDEQKEELKKAKEDGKLDFDGEHQKEEPPATETPEDEEEEKELTPKERLQQLGQEIIDSDDFNELVDGLPPDTERKFRQAQKDMVDAGYGDVNMRKDLTHTPEMVEALQRKRDVLIDAVMRGEMSEADYIQTMKMDRMALYKQAVGGAALDINNYGTDFDPGDPTRVTKNDNNGTYWLNESRKRFGTYLENTANILDPKKPLVGGLEGTAMTRSRIAHELSLLVADHTAAAQGPWGSCWTCGGNQMALAWRPDDYSHMVDQVIHTGKFVSPYTNQTINFPSDIIRPSRSNLNYNMMQADNGEQQYTAKIGQYVVGVASGNNEPWDGGVTEYAGKGLEAITGIKNVPWIDPRGGNTHIPTNRLGGIDGLIDGINNGTVRVANYIPFPGHAAENSGFLLANGEGKFVGFGVNDNSWGQGGENAFLATKENANKFVFPKGGGTRFSDPLGGSTIGTIGAMNSIIGNMNRQQAMQNALGQQQSAQQRAAQQQQMAQNQKEQEDKYNKLSSKEKRMLRVYCVRSTKPSAGIPTACRKALTDKSLGAYVPGEKFDLPIPSGDIAGGGVAQLTAPQGATLAGI